MATTPDKSELWTRFCNYYRFYPSVGVGLDISRMRFPADFFEKMAPKFRAADAAMKELEKGAIANPDEQRMVGHYWLRTPELAPKAELKKSIEDALSKVEDFALRVHRGEICNESGETFLNVLVIGIGGSALGPQLVADAFWEPANPMHMFFCDNTDPDGIQRTLMHLGSALSRTLILVISKSGGTVETKNGQLEVAYACKVRGLNFASQAVAVTGEGSKLDNLAKEEGWLERFPMWDWVGGRTSLFATVGLLPAALQGVHIREFLKGAREMDAVTRAADATNNPAMQLAAMRYYIGNGRGEKDMVVLPYKDRLVLFSKYLQQLVMESLGKEKDLSGKVVNQGIAVYGNKGSTDQHAYVQQLRDGVLNFFVTFISVLQDCTKSCPAPAKQRPLEVAPSITSGDFLNGFYLGTRQALYENGRESISIMVDALTPTTLGALIALYERAVGFYASFVGINAYHQPGVEAGKKAAEKVVALERELRTALKDAGAKGETAAELAVRAGAPDDAETAFFILEHMASNKEGVKRSGERSPQQARYSCP